MAEHPAREILRNFLHSRTLLRSVPHVPEISLHLAYGSMRQWRHTEEMFAARGLLPPYWAFAWAGGQALARYLFDHPQFVTGKRVLDFAAGSGIASIAARKAGATSTAAVDIDPFTEYAVTLNADANRVWVDTAVRDFLVDSPPVALGYDVVLVSDLFFDGSTARRAISFLMRQAASGTPILIGEIVVPPVEPWRSFVPKNWLVRLCEYQIEVTHEVNDSEIKRTAVWLLANH